MTEITPMMKQYLEIKKQIGDAILFFRLGDFYEMFGDDAALASKELEITLTGRGQGENRSPMCGVPHHSAQPYIAKLIQKGFKVAICEQMEDPSIAQGIVKREVVKIITPGTLIDPALLSQKTNNFLASITKRGEDYFMAFVDVSTGEFKMLAADRKKILDEIDRLSPSECLLSEEAIVSDEVLVSALNSRSILITKYNLKDIYDVKTAYEKLLKHFNISTLNGFGISSEDGALCCASAIIDYLNQTQKTNVSHINSLKKYHVDDFMHMDSTTRRNLELVKTIKERTYEGSLLSIIDATQTPMGGRMLRSWLLFPLCDHEKINFRLDCVSALYENIMVRQELASCLKEISDIERLTSKISCLAANARDLAALKDSISYIPKIKDTLKSLSPAPLKKIINMRDLTCVYDLITNAIESDPPFSIREGGIIKKGYSAELEELRDSSRKNKEWISNLEEQERIRTGIKSLKVGFTKVFGYYIEVSTSNLKYVPQDYIRKQTLVNCERYITPQLKEKESFVLNADDRIVEMEYNIFCEIRKRISEFTADLQEAALLIGEIDCFLSLAKTAASNNYSRPKVSSFYDSSRLSIKGGRHPVVEKTLGSHLFVPNDITMDMTNSFLMITGPNMSGKSTYMRQAAVIVLLAQIGSFVPADSAEIPIVDRIFTRVGAFDDLYSGQSTFMVEMLETANILNNATEKSLIILDEIGRGTATFDGMSIAGAVAEFIYTKIKAKTLFATHYHELTQLGNKFSGMKNLNVSVKEEGDQITFLHKIVEGSADKSYGIHVAKLAGLPSDVITRAKDIYNTLEMVENNLGKI